jgi:hypothetical protein
MLELAGLGRVLLAFTFVMALLALLTTLAARCKLSQRLARIGLKNNADQHTGLSVEDVLYLDQQHRVITLRRAQKRHVVLLSSKAEVAPLVIETYEVATQQANEVSHG